MCVPPWDHEEPVGICPPAAVVISCTLACNSPHFYTCLQTLACNWLHYPSEMHATVISKDQACGRATMGPRTTCGMPPARRRQVSARLPQTLCVVQRFGNCVVFSSGRS